jgi:hypothetical protein
MSIGKQENISKFSKPIAIMIAAADSVQSASGRNRKPSQNYCVTQEFIDSIAQKWYNLF